MENTSLTEADRLYIISFGDSRSYLLPVREGEDRFAHLEKELNDYLGVKFPAETFAYYTTPRLMEIEPEHAEDYAAYPLLDDRAMEEIKRVLLREIEVMHEDRELNSNAPWAD